jgi:hypothetical protein
MMNGFLPNKVGNIDYLWGVSRSPEFAPIFEKNEPSAPKHPTNEEPGEVADKEDFEDSKKRGRENKAATDSTILPGC